MTIGRGELLVFRLQFTHPAMPTHYIFIGNPGTGKSTLLNVLCKKNLFEGGYTVGCGLTTAQKQHTIGDITYTDTPGLDDAEEDRRANACAEISKALKSGGDYKVFFIVEERRGCVVPEDAGTMNMVLDAAPEITINKFGVIVNQVTDRRMTIPQIGYESIATFTAYLFCKRPHRSTAHILFLPMIPEMQGTPSDKINFVNVCGLKEITKLIEFVNETPSTCLTVEKSKNIDPKQIHDYITEARKGIYEHFMSETKLGTLRKQIAANNTQSGASKLHGLFLCNCYPFRTSGRS